MEAASRSTSIEQPEVRLRLLVRRAEEGAKRAVLSPLLDAGAEVVEGDLSDRVALERATQGRGRDRLGGPRRAGRHCRGAGCAGEGWQTKRRPSHPTVRLRARLVQGDAGRTHDVRYARESRRTHPRAWPRAGERPPGGVYGHVPSGKRARSISTRERSVFTAMATSVSK